MSRSTIKMMPKAQKIQLCLSVLLVFGVFIYTFFNFPPMLKILNRMGIGAELSPSMILFLKWFWVLTLVPAVLLLLIFVFHRNAKNLGTAMLIFAAVSSISIIILTLYMQQICGANEEPKLPAGVEYVEIPNLLQPEILIMYTIFS